MLFTSSVLIALAAGIAQAQTPSGFTPAASQQLDVIFNSTRVSTPGQTLAKSAVATQPQLALPSSLAQSSNNYLFVMLDLDVPGQGSNTTRRVLLHALVTDFTPTAQSVAANGTTKDMLLKTTSKGPASYISPGPPATDTVAHRYVQLLFQQPSTLDISASQFSNQSARINFDINSFVKKNSLSNPVAGNFFRVDGQASSGSSGSSTASGGIAKNTLQPFQGAAGKSTMSWGLAGFFGLAATLFV